MVRLPVSPNSPVNAASPWATSSCRAQTPRPSRPDERRPARTQIDIDLLVERVMIFAAERSNITVEEANPILIHLA